MGWKSTSRPTIWEKIFGSLFPIQVFPAHFFVYIYTHIYTIYNLLFLQSFPRSQCHNLHCSPEVPLKNSIQSCFFWYMWNTNSNPWGEFTRGSGIFDTGHLGSGTGPCARCFGVGEEPWAVGWASEHGPLLTDPETPTVDGSEIPNKHLGWLKPYK